jgi:hypothetical protein
MTVEPTVAAEVQRRANGRCEYCKMHQSLQGATFHIEHVKPRSKGGESSLENLAWACPSCNLHKSDRISLPDVDGVHVRLFNPRLDKWDEHFCWVGFFVAGTTGLGKALVLAFSLNTERKVKIRQAEKMFDLFPP